MEVAALWIAIVTALATGAATIVAWASRADALAAKKSADAAQVAAVEAWQRAAGALEEANRIQVEITSAATARERRIRRAEMAEPASHLFASECIRVATGAPAVSDAKAKRDIMLRITGSGEPAGFLLLNMLDRTKKDVIVGDFVSSAKASSLCISLAREWVEDPETFESTHRGTISPERMAEQLAEAEENFTEAQKMAARIHGSREAPE